MSLCVVRWLIFCVDVALWIIAILVAFIVINSLTGCARNHHDKLPPNTHITLYSHCREVAIDATTHNVTLICPAK